MVCKFFAVAGGEAMEKRSTAETLRAQSNLFRFFPGDEFQILAVGELICWNKR